MLALAGLMAACQPTGDVTQPYEPPIRTVAESPEAAACMARGGTMQRVGRAQSLQCVVAYADAGKRCTDGDQCQGDCRVEDTPWPAAGAQAAGVCQADSRPFGCYAKIESGRAEAALCVD